MDGEAHGDRARHQDARAAGPIVLVRHGRPDLSRGGLLTAPQWNAWWEAYNRAGLVYGEEPPQDLLAVARDAVHRLSSPLPRACETARAVYGPRIYDIDPLFVEAPLPAPPLPFVRLTPPQWMAASRTAWLLGYAGGGESVTLASKRAQAGADRLETAAADGSVVLCGHGWFNRMLRRALVRRGWICDRDGGDHYWAWRRLVRRPVD
ncbi:MAG: histidine phosphatase family protein [Alphaproteobacteria bacterium]